ncbi:MAG: hypothetical protein KGH86_05370 [Thaumarchaeota archaeon]|nr:hypothetical protein [Nitrososphaerota archaeon]
MWQKLEEYGKKLPPFSEEFDRKMTRKIMQMPAEIPWLFEAYRFELRKRVKGMKELQKIIPNVNVNDDTKGALELICNLIAHESEEKINIWDHIEALALNQIEFGKDLKRLIRISEPKNKKIKEFNTLVQKISKREKDNSKFAKDYQKKLPYINRFKDYLDHEAGKTSKK